MKQERIDNTPRPRKIARPNENSTQLEIDESGDGFREASTDTLGYEEPEMIEID